MKKLLLLFIFNLTLFAHPHVFVDIYLNILNDKKIDKIQIEWHFDEMNSEILILDYDKNSNRKFESNEVNNFKKEVFVDLIQNYNFYTFLEIDNKKIDDKKLIENFNLDIKKSKFVVKFDLNLKELTQISKVKCKFSDSDMMNAFELEKKNIKFSKKIKYTLKEGLEFYGYDLIMEF